VAEPTQENELQIQKNIELAHCCNLPNVFTDYKGIIKSLNPVVNAPNRVKVSIKILQNLKRGGQSRKIFLTNVQRQGRRKLHPLQ
jgi:hypothetical protein